MLSKWVKFGPTMRRGAFGSGAAMAAIIVGLSGPAQAQIITAPGEGPLYCTDPTSGAVSQYTGDLTCVANGGPYSITSVTATGTVEGSTVTDGTASLTGGALTGATNGTFSGTVQGGTVTDGTASLTGGALTGATNGTFSGTVQGGTLTDGTASLTGGHSLVPPMVLSQARSRAVR